MKAVFAILALCVVASVCAVHIKKEPIRLAQPMVEEMWQNFIVSYNKSYETTQEYNMRRAIFRNGLIRAAQLNAESRGQTRFGVTKFSDLTPEEFQSQVLMNNPPAIDYELLRSHYKKVEYTEAAPTDKTWVGSGVLTPVYNQGQCGSCWAFSATEQLESRNQQKNGRLVGLSMQQTVDCDSQAYGCGGGWTYSAYEYVRSAGGQDTYQSYPYTAQNGNCQFSSSNIGAKIASWSYITQNGDEEEMRNYVGSTAPVSICADASQWQYYQGGVFMSSQCGDSIDHCIQAVGYKMSAPTPYWIVRNSWGADWGENGYIYLQYGQNTCALGNVATTVDAQ